MINCKVESKLIWIRYCILPAAGNENENDKDNNNASNIIFTIKEIICSFCNFISKRQSKSIKTF